MDLQDPKVLKQAMAAMAKRDRETMGPSVIPSTSTPTMPIIAIPLATDS